MTLKKVRALSAISAVAIEVGVVAYGVIPCPTFPTARNFRTAHKHNYFVAAGSRSVAYAAKRLRGYQCRYMEASLGEPFGSQLFLSRCLEGTNLRDQ